MLSQLTMSYIPSLEVIPRRDGSFDVFEKSKNGELTLLSTHDTMEEAQRAKEDWQGPTSQMDVLDFVRQRNKLKTI
jgi:hypothetical protein